MNSPIARWVGFVTLAVCTFLVGLIVTFPMGLVRDVIEAQTEKALNFEYDVDIERVRFSGINGVRLLGVTVASRATPEPGDVQLPLRVDSVRARVGILSALRRQPEAKIDVRAGDGRLRITVAQRAEGRDLKLEFFELEIAQIQPIRQWLAMPIQGEINGTVLLTYGEDARLSSGDVEIGIRGLVIGPGDLRSEMFRPFGGSIPLPTTDFGNVIVRAPIDRSAIEIREFAASGLHVRIDARGDIQLRAPYSASRVSLTLELQLDGRYVEDAGLGAVLGLPDVQRLQTGEGYALSISGPASRPSISPAARGPR